MEMKPKTRLWSRPPRLLLAALAGSSLAAVACGGNELVQRDLGNTNVPDSAERTPVVKEDGEIDRFVAGRWLGQAEDLFRPPGPDGVRPSYTFPSGSKQITLDLVFGDPAQNLLPSSLGGAITFGEGPVPEPAAGVFYPPGISPREGDLAAIPPLEGFSYRVLQQQGTPTPTTTGALAVGYGAGQSYADWCALQPPRGDVSGTFDCITPLLPPYDAPSRVSCTDRQEAKDPTSGITFGMNLHYDCNLGWLCGRSGHGPGACTCTQKGCAGNYYEGPVQLWLIRSGEDLLGSFVGAVFDYGDPEDYLPVSTVHFKREAP
jgi:hypothetical protein